MKKSGLADSPFFKAIESEKVMPAKSQTVFVAEPISERNSERTETRTEYRTLPLPTKRRSTRYSFEFFEDQIVKIKRLKYEAEQAGQKLSLSDIARQALDEYLADK